MYLGLRTPCNPLPPLDMTDARRIVDADVDVDVEACIAGIAATRACRVKSARSIVS